MSRNIFDKTKDYLFSPKYRFIIKMNKGAYDSMGDEEFLRKEFRMYMGYDLDLEHPVTFNEKLQWLKLHDRNDLYTIMADKYAVKQYIAEKLGEQYVIPTLGVWKKAEDIDFDMLPEQFVFKTTHDSQGIIICKNKGELDKQKTVRQLTQALKRNYYLKYREWPYKNIEPRIIAEKYMSDGSGELTDYKVHNFNGKAKIVLVCKNRFSEQGATEDFFDINWKHLDIKRPEKGNAKEVIEKPQLLPEILDLSERLAENSTFMRTDFYIIDNKVYFGEITFFPAGGLKPFEPDSADRVFGEWITLPTRRN